VFLYAKVLKVQVAKYTKVPLGNIRQKDAILNYPEQHFFRQQVAYVFDVNEIQSGETTKNSLLVQKKRNMLLYMKFRRSALHALLQLGSLAQKYHKMHNNISFLDNLLDLSIDHSLTFLGVDNELYTAYRLDNDFKIVRISDGVDFYELSAFKTIGVGLPLYNNFIPIVVAIDNTFIVMLYDITNKTSHKIANYSIESLEKHLGDYIKKITGRDISKNIGHYRKFYNILEPYRFTDSTASESFEICSNLSVCGAVLYIGNRAINEYSMNYAVFKMEFKIRNQKLYYKLSIPRGLSFESLGLEKTPAKHVIETQTLSIRLPKGNYMAANILYYQNNILILKDFVYNGSYYILNLKKHTKNRICTKNTYGMRFYMVDNIIMIVYLTATKLSREQETWHLMIYDTIRARFFNTPIINEWYLFAGAKFLLYHYIEKCKKVVFILGKVDDRRMDFVDLELYRTMYTASAITIIDLSKVANITDNDDIEKCKETIKFPSSIENYLIAKGYKSVYISSTDCAVDVRRSMLYVTASVAGHKNPVITLAKNLCDGNTKFYDFDLGIPILRTRDLTKDRTRPIYISSKALKSADFPKYLHMYDLRGFYNFVNSKTINTGLVFISYPDFRIVDRYYNRVSQFYKVFSDFYLKSSLLIDSYLVGYYTIERDQTRSLGGLFVINDLTIVKMP
jgi:hypothetical protein